VFSFIFNFEYKISSSIPNGRLVSINFDFSSVKATNRRGSKW
jgi:hypothetical protein